VNECYDGVMIIGKNKAHIGDSATEFPYECG